MSQKNEVSYVLETVSGAFGISDEIPWGRAHRQTFSSLAEAEQERNRDATEMNERCGHSAWDGHRRIVPTADTTATFHLICSGHLGWNGSHGSCSDMAEIRVTTPWPAGKPCPQPEPPAGWYATYQCNACAEREAQVVARLRAEYDQEEQERHDR